MYNMQQLNQEKFPKYNMLNLKLNLFNRNYLHIYIILFNIIFIYVSWFNKLSTPINLRPRVHPN